MRLIDAFESWRERGLLPELTRVEALPTRSRYVFAGMCLSLTLSVSESGACITALGPDDGYWDMLLDCDIEAEVTATGVQCQICLAEGRPGRFESMEALFEDHVLHPLQTWYATKLAPATHLRLKQQNGCTWAELVQQADDAEPHSFMGIPIREIS